jgi:hypothetical protein
MIDWYTCPLTGKRAYRNRKDARAARAATKNGGVGGALSLYRCEAEGGCGDWHLGHLPPGETRAKLRDRREADEARDRRLRGETA